MNASWRKGQRAPAAPPPTTAPALHSHMNKSCHISMSDGTYEVMAEMRETTCNTNSHHCSCTSFTKSLMGLLDACCLHTHTQSCVCTHTHSHVSAHTHTVMCLHTHTQSCLHTHTQSCVCTHTHSHGVYELVMSFI